MFLVISVTPVRETIAKAIPTELRLGTAAGIGVFLTFIGLKNAGLIAADPVTFVKLGTLGVPAPLVEPRLRPLELGRAPDGRALSWKERAFDWQAGRDPIPAEGESLEGVGHRVGDFVRALARSR